MKLASSSLVLLFIGLLIFLSCGCAHSRNNHGSMPDPLLSSPAPSQAQWKPAQAVPAPSQQPVPSITSPSRINPVPAASADSGALNKSDTSDALTTPSTGSSDNKEEDGKFQLSPSAEVSDTSVEFKPTWMIWILAGAAGVILVTGSFVLLRKT